MHTRITKQTGLFFAVVTAFVIETFPRLEADPAERTAEVLERVSLQLASFTISGAMINSSVPAISPAPPPNPEQSIVSVNTFWFISLLFSRASAFFNILVQQWLRNYINLPTFGDRDWAVLRQWRYDAIRQWRLPQIIVGLALLLQTALFLFCSGLLVLLWAVNHPVAKATSVAAAIFAVILALMLLLPSICPTCPHKSPLVWAALRVLQCTLYVTYQLHMGEVLPSAI